MDSGGHRNLRDLIERVKLGSFKDVKAIRFPQRGGTMALRGAFC